MARRSLCTNLPAASTVKSVVCATTTAALPELNWPRSTLATACSHSGAFAPTALVGAQLEHPSTTAANQLNRGCRLVAAQNDDFLIVLSDFIEKTFRAQI